VFVAVILTLAVTALVAGALASAFMNGALYMMSNGAWGLAPSGVGTTPPVNQNPCGPGTTWDPTTLKCLPTATPNGACVPVTNAGAAATEAGVSNGMSKAQLTSTTYVAIFSADHTTEIDSYSIAAAVSVGTGIIYPGTAYTFEVSSTAGNGYIDSWYTLHSGWSDCSPIYYVEPGMGSLQYITPYGPSVPNVPLGTTTEVQAGTIRYVPGQTNYWLLGQQGTLLVFQRESAANIKYAMDVPGTRGVRSATGAVRQSGNPWSNATSNYSSTSQTFSLNLNIALSDLSEVYGYPMISWTQLPTPVMHIGYLAVWFALNNTNSNFANALTTATPQWSQLPNGITPGYEDFVQIIAPVESTPVAYGNVNVNIPIDDGSLNGGSTKVGAAVWVADNQLYPNVLSASSYSPAPTVYAPVVRYGITSDIYSSGFSISSSNAPQTSLDFVIFTT